MFINQAIHQLFNWSAANGRLSSRVAFIATILIVTSAYAQVVSPIRANPNDGTVIPLQCLGCFASSSFYVKSNDPAVSERPLQVGDFIKSTSSTYQIRRPWRRDQYAGNFDFFIENANGLFMFTGKDSEAKVSFKVGLGESTLYGFYIKPHLTFRDAYFANGVCKGPILDVAKQFVYDSASQPLNLFERIGDIANGIVIADNRSPSGQPGIGSIPTDRFLICFDELQNAKEYYENIQSEQVNKALEIFKQNSTREQIEKYVKSAVQEHLGSAEKEITDRIVRLTIETLQKQGFKVPPKPPKIP